MQPQTVISSEALLHLWKVQAQNEEKPPLETCDLGSLISDDCNATAPFEPGEIGYGPIVGAVGDLL